jgi:hypothetical protein
MLPVMKSGFHQRSPKYLPPDILVNIPFDTTIIPGDDFIFKKKQVIIILSAGGRLP